MVVLDKKTWVVRIIILIVLVLCIGGFFYFRSGSVQEPVVIVLASSEESAHASLGGFISTTKDIQIETYSSSEEIEMTRDIQSLIASFGNREVRVYGPALGTLHNAFIHVAKGYPKDTVHFFIYENNPEAEEYARTHVASLERYIEDTQEISLTKIILPFEKREVVYELSL